MVLLGDVVWFRSSMQSSCFLGKECCITGIVFAQMKTRALGRLMPFCPCFPAFLGQEQWSRGTNNIL